MEWVETTGRSVEQAKDAALDQLGVDESEAEFEILEEAKTSLFGMVRREARVRARVRPAQPRPKAERRERRKRGGGKGRSERSPKKSKEKSDQSPDAKQGDKQGGGSSGQEAGSGSGQRRRRRSRGGSGGGSGEGSASRDVEQVTTSQPGGATVGAEITMSIEAQGEAVADFMDGVVGAFDLDAEISTVPVDEETVEVRLDGDDLGLLIGPKGQTLAALQELARTVIYRQADGPTGGRVRLDVSGYREKRRVALEQFARSVADEVKQSGKEKALEPMGAPDRKIVHDTVNALDGVVTVSEGEEPRRRVVIRPAD